MNKQYLLVALLIYGVFSLATLFSWHIKGINTVTGDEPHYLVMASGLVKQGSLEQTAPYREEFKTRQIYRHGLAPEDAQPSPENTHAVLGPNGLFNVHNFGLPILLAVPFLFGGVIGAKLIMVLFSSLIVVVAWKFSFYFSQDKIPRFWAVIATTISLPFIPASNQVYPDLLAGLIALTGLYWFYTVDARRPAGLETLLAVTIAFLPWLQIKFAATCLILVLSITTRIYFQSRDIKKIAQIFVISGASFLALATYNYYAFGKISGPYQASALEISKTSLMVLLGLHIDQNQGFILQNPVNLIGILAIGWMYKFNRIFSIVWALVFLSLIIPNALHPNWYGGWSFSGRFQWAAATLFIIPTIYGLIVIPKRNKMTFKAIITSGLLLQFYFFYQYAISGVNLYNKNNETWFDNYSIFYYPIHAWMPMLYNSTWAYGYWPNYSWMVLIGALLLLGFLKKVSRKSYIILFSSLLLIFAAGLSKNHPKEETIFKADQLPSQTGRVVNSGRFAEQNVDKPGFVNYGPYFPLRKGSYEVVFLYKSPSEKSEVIGWVDVFNATLMSQLIQIPIHGTSNARSEQVIKFEVTQWKPNSFEFRTYWNGASNIEVEGIVLKKNMVD